MLICHSCGAPVESKSKQCHRCRNAISVHAAVGLLEPETGGPLKVQLELQPRTLDSLIAADLINAASKSSFNRVNPPAVPKNGENGSRHYIQAVSDNFQGIGSPPDFFDRLPEMFRENIATQEEDGQENLDWKADEHIPPVNDTGVKQAFGSMPEPASNPVADPASSPIANPASSSVADPESNPVASPISNASAFSAGAGFKRLLDDGLMSDRSSSAVPKNGSSIEKTPGAGEAAAETFADIASAVEANKDSEVNRRSFSDQKYGKINSLNLQTSWPLYLGLGLVTIFLLFKAVEALYLTGTSLLANSSNIAPIGGQANLSGRWQFAARSNNDSCQGQMVLHQQGSQLFGEGVDNSSARYKFSGQCSGTHIDLVKQYFGNNGFIGHTIQMQGDLDAASRQLDIQGDYSIEYMAGGKWRGKPVSIKGIWEAKMLQPLIEDESALADAPMLRKIDERPSFGSVGNNLAKNGIWYAVIGITIAVSAWHFMSSLIGPDGWLGIWDKQKYIPPQFMKEHKIEKRQLSKPLVPGSLPLGRRWEWQFWQKYFFWIPKDLALPPNVRVNNPHVLILGGGEKGKSRLMANMIAHDIESNDRAVVVVDSDGDLADLLFRWIAAHPQASEIAKRTIIIDPTSNLPSPSFNPLELPENADMQNAASAIVHGFKAIYHEPPGSQNQWSPQTAHILRNAAMLLMANGKTLIDLPTLLQDNDFRDIMLEKIEKRKNEKVEFATLLETWGQYKRLARTEQWINWYEPILNRVGPTLINLRIRPILTQAQGDINLKQIIVDKKILIVKIPKGQLHDDANLLGSLIVTGLKQAAITLCTEGKVTDRTAAMYLDEFDNFIEKETLDAITTETKKFQLGFVGSTKTLQHMPEDFRNQIVINMGTMCVFALSKKDGDMIGPQMFRVSGRKAKHRTLMNIVNKVNTSPQFELISDEEKYNIDRILGQSEREFYAYRVGAVAGTFRMKCHDFNDVPDNKVDAQLIESMYKNR